MKIVIPMLGISEAGGIKVLFKMADALIDNGWNVEFITFGAKEVYDKINIKTKARIIDLGKPKVLRICRWILNPICKCFLLYKNIPECDFLVANYFLTAYPIFFSRKAKYKLYYCQAYEVEFFKNFGIEYLPLRKRLRVSLANAIFKILAFFSYRLGLKMFANNARIVEKIKEQPGMKNVEIPLLPPFVDLAIFKPEKREKRADGLCRVGIIASANFWKGTKYFLEAVKILREREPELKFEVVCAFGPPPPGSPEIECKWVRPKSQEQLAEFYKGIDILVSPMLLTGEFPLPPLEGMACGCAVISTKIIYGKHLEHYYMIPPGDAEAIAEAIKTLLTNRELREHLQRNGLELAKEFSYEKFKQRTIELFTRLGGETP